MRSSMQLGRAVIAMLLGVLWGTPAQAWNKPGHMVSGAIAYDVLAKEDAAALKTCVDLLRQSGMFAKRIAEVPAEQQDRVLFMLAARWPDDIRNNPDLHHAAWHFRDLPYVPPGDNTKPPEPAAENALTALDQNLKILAAKGEPLERAQALCWVLHLVGDIHQPLHAISLYSATYPEGDRGGNLQFIRATETSHVINLHSLWDGLILGSEKYQDAQNTATELELRPAFAKDKLVELADRDPEHWAKESYDAAVKTAYLDGKLSSGTDEHDGPVLPEGYLDAAKATAEQRLILAGYRLAEKLHAATTKPQGDVR